MFLEMSISFKKATNKTNLKHNNRQQKKYDNDKIDISREKENKYLIQENIRDLYEREFGEALEVYNKKQRRSDRKIKNYYEHVKASKKTAVQQELVVQIGTGYNGQDYTFGDDNWHKVNEILEEYINQFEKRNPNLKVYNAVIHNDETSPHLHINFVPVASGYKRGLEKQVAFNRAIKQQDKQFDVSHPFEAWRESEINEIEKLMNERNIERETVGTNEYKDTNELKKITAEREKLEKERELLEEEKKSFFQHKEKKIDVADIEIEYSHKEKKIEEYEEIEKNMLGFERKVKKQREVETGGFVFAPEQVENIERIVNYTKELKADYERLNGVLNDEVNLRKKLEQEHQYEIDNLKSDLNARAERLKDDKYKSLEKENKELKSRLNDKQKRYDILADNHTKISKEKQVLAEKLELAVEDNERLYNENDKLRDRVDYYKWRFRNLWNVTKEYLNAHAKEGVKYIKEWFKADTGEEIEPKTKRSKNKDRGFDLEL